jgi:hypothetical protein
MQRRTFVAASAASVPFARHRSAAPATDPDGADRPWTLRGSESFDLESTSVGDTFVVGVWPPNRAFLEARGLSAASELDLVYVLDGSWALNLAASICLLQLVDTVRPGFPPLLLVGVDYPEGRPNARTRDYTPPDDGSPQFPRLAEMLKLGATPQQTPGGRSGFSPSSGPSWTR